MRSRLVQRTGHRFRLFFEHDAPLLGTVEAIQAFQVNHSDFCLPAPRGGSDLTHIGVPTQHIPCGRVNSTALGGITTDRRLQLGDPRVESRSLRCDFQPHFACARHVGFSAAHVAQVLAARSRLVQRTGHRSGLFFEHDAPLFGAVEAIQAFQVNHGNLRLPTPPGGSGLTRIGVPKPHSLGGRVNSKHLGFTADRRLHLGDRRE